MTRVFGPGLFSVLTAIVLAITANAASIVHVNDNLVRLSLAKKLNFTGSSTILAHDHARAKLLRARAEGKLTPRTDATDEPVTNAAVTYVASVGVGSPATQYSLIVDTGSSNTWVGGAGPLSYRRTSSSRPTYEPVSVTYGSGFFAGFEWTDRVSLGNGLTIANQSIGVARASSGFDRVDGILGLGPVKLTEGTLELRPDTRIPTVTDNLFAQGTIPLNQVAVSFAPTETENTLNGQLTFGGVDPTKFIGNINYAPITSTSPASRYWGIDQSIRYGASTPIMSTTAGIVDTGTTLLMIASDAFARYQAATGAVFDTTTGLLRITPAQYATLESLFFTIHEITYELTRNAQIWPRALNAEIGGDPNSIYLITADVGAPSGGGLDFVNGQAFHERFYTVYDTTNRRVGLANTPFTSDESN